LPPPEAVADISDGATIMVGGFGEAGSPIELLHALIDQGATDLTIVSNNTGSAVRSDSLPSSKRGAYPKRSARSLERPTRPSSPSSTGAAVSALELVPQGTLAERIRCGGAGLPAFYTPTAVGTPLAEGKELREFEGKQYVMERGLRADFTLIKGSHRRRPRQPAL
jgi:3-oxoadipate CoA-transferase alpha subunit